MGYAIVTTNVQQIVVTVDPDSNQRIVITPAVNTSQAQQLAISVAGIDQTVVVRPVE